MVISLPLIAIMLVALFTVHLRYGFSSINTIGLTRDGPVFGPPGYEVVLLYIAGLLSFILGGAGIFSVDSWIIGRLSSFTRLPLEASVHRLLNPLSFAAGQLAVFQGASEVPHICVIRVERATRKNSQLAAAERVALKMGRWLRCSSVTYQSRYALAACLFLIFKPGCSGFSSSAFQLMFA